MENSAIPSVLTQTPLFTDLTPAALEQLAEAVVSRNYARHQVLFEAGAPGDSLFVLVDGPGDAAADAGGVEDLRRQDHGPTRGGAPARSMRGASTLSAWPGARTRRSGCET